MRCVVLASLVGHRVIGDNSTLPALLDTKTPPVPLCGLNKGCFGGPESQIRTVFIPVDVLVPNLAVFPDPVGHPDAFPCLNSVPEKDSAVHFVIRDSDGREHVSPIRYPAWLHIAEKQSSAVLILGIIPNGAGVDCGEAIGIIENNVPERSMGSRVVLGS